jgi:hypothetical protein
MASGRGTLPPGMHGHRSLTLGRVAARKAQWA